MNKLYIFVALFLSFICASFVGDMSQDGKMTGIKLWLICTFFVSFIYGVFGFLEEFYKKSDDKA